MGNKRSLCSKFNFSWTDLDPSSEKRQSVLSTDEYFVPSDPSLGTSQAREPSLCRTVTLRGTIDLKDIERIDLVIVPNEKYSGQT